MDLRSIKDRLLALALGCLIAAPLWGQGATSLRGIVTDAQKGILADAKVTLTDKEGGVSRATITSNVGAYQFLQLRPGAYSLTVEAAGFASKSVGDIHLLVDTPATLDVLLEVAAN